MHKKPINILRKDGVSAIWAIMPFFMVIPIVFKSTMHDASIQGKVIAKEQIQAQKDILSRSIYSSINCTTTLQMTGGSRGACNDTAMEPLILIPNFTAGTYGPEGSGEFANSFLFNNWYIKAECNDQGIVVKAALPNLTRTDYRKDPINDAKDIDFEWGNKPINEPGEDYEICSHFFNVDPDTTDRCDADTDGFAVSYDSNFDLNCELVETRHVTNGEVQYNHLNPNRFVNNRLIAHNNIAGKNIIGLTTLDFENDIIRGPHVAIDALNSSKITDGSLNRTDQGSPPMANAKISTRLLNKKSAGAPGPITRDNLCRDGYASCAGALMTGVEIKDYSVTNSNIGSILNAADKLSTTAVKSEDIKNGSITGKPTVGDNTDPIDDRSVNTGHIIDGSVTGSDVGAQQIKWNHLQANIIGGNRVADYAIRTQAILDCAKVDQMRADYPLNPVYTSADCITGTDFRDQDLPFDKFSAAGCNDGDSIVYDTVNGFHCKPISAGLQMVYGELTMYYQDGVASYGISESEPGTFTRVEDYSHRGSNNWDGISCPANYKLIACTARNSERIWWYDIKQAVGEYVDGGYIPGPETHFYDFDVEILGAGNLCITDDFKQMIATAPPKPGIGKAFYINILCSK